MDVSPPGQYAFENLYNPRLRHQLFRPPLSGHFLCRVRAFACNAVITMASVMASAREAHLEPRLVGDISGMFYVPAYQRGYRWGERG